MQSLGVVLLQQQERIPNACRQLMFYFHQTQLHVTNRLRMRKQPESMEFGSKHMILTST